MSGTGAPARRWFGLGFVAVMLVLAGLTAPSFAIEADLTKMLPENHPYYSKLSAGDGTSAGARTLLVVLREFRDLEPLVRELRASPYLERVDATRDEFLDAGARRMRAAPLWFVPPETLEEVAQRLEPKGRAAALDRLDEQLAGDPFAGREIALRDPLGLRWILEAAGEKALPVALAKGTPYVVLADGSRALLRLVGKREPYDYEFAKLLLADVESRLAGRDVMLFGGYSVAVRQERMIKSDLAWNSTLSILLVTFYLAWSTRSWLEPLVLFLPSVLAIACSMPIGCWLFGPLSPLAISAAAILSGLGDDCPIHWLVRYDEERRTLPHDEAVVATRRAVFRPMLGAILTTMAAFLSLAFGRFRGLTGFGLLLALGLVLSFGFTFVLMPWLVKLRRARPALPGGRMAGSKLVAWALVGLALVGAVAIAVRGIEFTTDPRAMRGADDPLLLVQAEVERTLGFSPIPMVATPDPALDADAIAGGVNRLVQRGILRYADGPFRDVPRTDQVERVREFQRRTAGWDAAALREIGERGWDAEAFRPGIAAFVTMFTAQPAPSDRRDLRLFLRAAPTDLPGFAAVEAAVHQELGAGTKVYAAIGLMAELRSLLRSDLVQAIVIASLAIVVLTLLAAGSLRAGLAALVTLVIAFAVTLGAVALLGVPLQIGNFVALPFVLGIGIDYGIFVVERMRQGGDLGETKVALIRKSVTTILGFGVLITAKTPGLSSMGAIAVLGITTCLLASVFVLPTLRGFVAPACPREGQGVEHAP